MEKVYTQVSHKIAVKNIKAMFAASSQTQIDAGMSWYQNAQDQAQVIAIKHDMPVYIVVAVIGHLYSKNNQRGVFNSFDGGKTWTKSLYLNDNTGDFTILNDELHHSIFFSTF